MYDMTEQFFYDIGAKNKHSLKFKRHVANESLCFVLKHANMD